jgi:predicted kinase
MANTNNDTLTLTIMQALPGAGKSHETKKVVETGAAVGSADAFPGLYSDNPKTGRVDIDVTKLGSAHGACARTVIEALRSGQSAVVDNTHLSATEIAPYLLIAQAYGAEPKLVTIKVDPRVAFERNTHGVPFAVIRNNESGEIRKTFAYGEGAGEGESVVGGFVTMEQRLADFSPEFHWRFIPGYEHREVEAG